MFKPKNKYTAIACVNEKCALGKNGELLYNIKSDMENFKRLTVGNVVIMGRSTFESLPGKKPLKGRINIVLTSNENYFVPDADEEFKDTYVCKNLEEADNLCYSMFPDKELFIIGGAITYELAFRFDMIDKVILTLVNDDKEGDCYFPPFENDEKFRVIFKTLSLRDQPTDTYYHYIVYKKNDGY